MWHSNWEHVSGSIEVNAVYEQLHQKYVRYLFQIKACVTFDHTFLERLCWKGFPTLDFLAKSDGYQSRRNSSIIETWMSSRAICRGYFRIPADLMNCWQYLKWYNLTLYYKLLENI